METADINKFCEKYIEKKKCESNPENIYKINFHLSYTNYHEIEERYSFLVNRPVQHQLFVLDDEDIDYLYKKYALKLKAEMDKNIEEIMKYYGNNLLHEK